MARLVRALVDINTDDAVARVTRITLAHKATCKIGTSRVVTAVIGLLRALVNFDALTSVIISIPITVRTNASNATVFDNALCIRITIERFAINVEYTF